MKPSRHFVYPANGNILKSKHLKLKLLTPDRLESKQGQKS